MKRFIITGKTPLKGTIKVSGSKNAALPIIAASLLTKEKTILKNIPHIEDIYALLEILKNLGVKYMFENHVLTIDPIALKLNHVPDDKIKKFRASVLLLAPLLARFKKVKLYFPGGCLIGKRPLDSHLYAFRKLHARVLEKNDTISLKTEKLKGNLIIMPELSVTATENAIMAACLAKGKTEIRLAAAEPHVRDLCRFLNKMGAKIKGIGNHVLFIDGVKKLHGITYNIIGDYLEAGTFAIAAAITNGDVLIQGVHPEELDSFWQKLEAIGVNFTLEKTNAHIFPTRKPLKSICKLQTAVYPSFPTDLQAPTAVLLTQARGVSKIFETLFEGRLSYLFELEKMGARMEILNPHQALIIGPSKLKGTTITSCDLRAGAALVIAALAAKGKTEIVDINYIDRGYERFDEKLKKLGAKIERI